ncbi:MAG: quinone-dependent dihydroorotate dehydrogenase [Rhodocyclaceae bacterium]|nr:quinone-dependent dihydroorotate dehydrogenase [Rhodocyclaceae bacterium]
MPYCLVKPFILALDPETAHELSIAGLRALGAIAPAGRPLPDTPVTVMGLSFPNRIGLAAGLDKNGEAIDALAGWGFGFIEVGTVTPRPQPGNPKPRMFRLPRVEGIINRMGFNNRGIDALVANVRAARYKGILGINIGKNADTPIERAADDYLIGLEKAYPHASYIAVNISSPNTKNLRALQGESELDALLGALKARQTELAQQHGHHVPLALKIAPDLDDAQIANIAAALRRHRIEAVIATNTTLDRAKVAGQPHAAEAGGLSGAPLFEASTLVVKKLAAALAGEVPIIAVGGVVDGAKAKAKLDAGAQLVQVYSGLVYRGPGLVKDCVATTRAQPC